MRYLWTQITILKLKIPRWAGIIFQVAPLRSTAWHSAASCSRRCSNTLHPNKAFHWKIDVGSYTPRHELQCWWPSLKPMYTELVQLCLISKDDGFITRLPGTTVNVQVKSTDKSFNNIHRLDEICTPPFRSQSWSFLVIRCHWRSISPALYGRNNHSEDFKQVEILTTIMFVVVRAKSIVMVSGPIVPSPN